MGLLVTGCSSVTEPLKSPFPARAGTESKLTLQYRVGHDAIAPSRFVGVVGDGITPGLNIVWELPPPKSEAMKVAQQEEMERFHRLIGMLEARLINGVEFECTGTLSPFVLRATTVPRPTDRGLRQIEASRP